jgi:hypothetical protein
MTRIFKSITKLGQEFRSDIANMTPLPSACVVDIGGEEGSAQETIWQAFRNIYPCQEPRFSSRSCGVREMCRLGISFSRDVFGWARSGSSARLLLAVSVYKS